MKSIHPPLVVHVFVILDKLSEEVMGFMNLCSRNSALCDNMDCMYQFAEMLPIFLWKYNSEKCWPKPEKI